MSSRRLPHIAGRADGWTLLCGLPASLLSLMFFVVPLLLLLVSGSQLSSTTGSAGVTGSRGLVNLLSDRFVWEILGFTIGLSAVLTSVCSALGFALALFVWGLRGPWKTLALLALLISKLSNILITAYGLKLLLGEGGTINWLLLSGGIISEPIALVHNWAGVLISETFFILPYAVLILWIALERIDPNLLLAARGLGASSAAVLYRVTFPLARPALWTAATMTFIWGLGAYVGPALFGSPNEFTVAVDVQRQAFENQNWPRALVESLLLLSSVLAIALLKLGGRKLADAGRERSA